MPNRSTFIESVDVLPVTGATVRFASPSGGDVLYFCMERTTAVKAAYDILRAVEAADMAELDEAEVVPILGFAKAG